ncbi:MAG: urease accessory protein UreH domain-containing protein [Rhodospirillales bacterium]
MLALCRAAADAHGVTLGTLFLAGLAGSATHCVGMCGPFVLGFTATRLAGQPAGPGAELRRAVGAALLPYHLGRITTYTLLGAISAAAIGAASMWTGPRWLQAALLSAAALAFLFASLGTAVRLLPEGKGAGPAWWWDRVARFAAPWAAQPFGFSAYALGVALGYLPCGLISAALAAASATGSALGGALAMAAFALGTVPGLAAVAWAGSHAARRWRRVAALFAPFVLAANAAVLAMIAFRALG